MRAHITCHRLDCDGKPLVLANVGFDRYDAPTLFLWCEEHRQFHDCSLKYLLLHLYSLSLSEENQGLRTNYLTVLFHAVVKCFLL